MLFNSYTFLLLFLPIACAGHSWLRRHAPREAVLAWLNVCSLFFYGWWNPAYLPLLMLSIGCNFYLGKQLATQANTATGKRLLITGIAMNLAALAYFKYTGFALATANAVLGTTFHTSTIVLPLAISFFTFNQIAYLVDAYEGMTDEYSFNHYTLFVSFFPHLLAGPIVHHRELIPQFFTDHDDSTRQQQWAVGITAISFGLFKKVIFADTLSGYANQVFNAASQGITQSTLEAWIGVSAFNLHVYFDFSGYCDIAYGTALLFGIVLPQNFLSPFKKPNIIEFWKHWHITLSRFITSYIYTPLIRNTPGGVLFSKAMLITVISMGIAGMWHGAGWTFIAYGLAHGILLVINHCWRKLGIAKKLAKINAFQFISILLTYTAVTLTMVLFRSPDLKTAGTLFTSLFSLGASPLALHVQQPVISDLCRQLQWDLTPAQKILPLFFFLHAWIWLLPNMQQIMANRQYAHSNIRQAATNIVWQPNTAWSLLTAFALVSAFMALYETGVFLYFKF